LAAAISTTTAGSTGESILKRTTALLIATIILSPATSFSQTRGRTTTKPSSRAAKTAKPSDALRDGATRVADHIKNLTRFVYLLGGVAKGIESVDDAAGRNEASPAILEQAKRNKVSVKTSIQSVREGLDALEIKFRTTPELERYYIKLAGVAAGAATAEDLAAANQFDRAGRGLLEVVSRLADVLVEMRSR
jgi:hypothetical protein